MPAMVFLNLWVKLQRFIELPLYYKNKTFRKLDLTLSRRYFWKNPYRVSRRFYESQGTEDPHQYGETPLATLAKIAKEANITSNDTLYDLGCGTGRTSLWFRLFTGCKVHGIEQNPTFIKNAPTLEGLTFLQEDMLKADYSKATIIYLYGTCLTRNEIEQLEKRFQALPEGSRIITVSYPLDGFPPIKEFTGRFPWGKATIFIASVVKARQLSERSVE